MSVRPRFSPRPLREDDEGYASENAQANFKAQDEAFCAAMRKAIAKGCERVAEGVMVTPPDEAKAILRPFVPAAILTGSELV
jgi:hypothetical protein